MVKMMQGMKSASAFYHCTLRRWLSASSHKLDPIQEAALEERCILVNEDDAVIGDASKRECHRVGAKGHLLLHRAFSVFLFNSCGQLLLQKRSPQKITFPNCFTNACCSHPLYNIEEEREEGAALGVRRAAQRRLNHELGIPMEEVPPEKMHYLTRIHYKAGQDDLWGEHEIDYIIFMQRDVTLNPNPEEISELRYISRDKLSEFLQSCNVFVTPWFRLIAKSHLQLWWDNLHQLNKFQDHKAIHRFS